MQDKVITCKDCGQEFTFTVGEQAFENDPVRCQACRRAKKERNRQ